MQIPEMNCYTCICFHAPDHTYSRRLSAGQAPEGAVYLMTEAGWSHIYGYGCHVQRLTSGFASQGTGADVSVATGAQVPCRL